MADPSSASYIHMVQHLIEKCLTYRMSKEKCMEALSKHANVEPVITSTVWNELEKVNKDFFQAYAAASTHEENKEDRMSEEETSQLIQNIMISDSSKDSDD